QVNGSETDGNGSDLISPREAVTPDQRACRSRTPRASRINLGPLVVPLPRFTNGIDPLPGGVELIATHEERQIAPDDVREQPLVRIEGARLESLREIETQVDRLQVHPISGALGEHGHRNALVGL